MIENMYEYLCRIDGIYGLDRLLCIVQFVIIHLLYFIINT